MVFTDNGATAKRSTVVCCIRELFLREPQIIVQWHIICVIKFCIVVKEKWQHLPLYLSPWSWSSKESELQHLSSSESGSVFGRFQSSFWATKIVPDLHKMYCPSLQPITSTPNISSWSCWVKWRADFGHLELDTDSNTCINPKKSNSFADYPACEQPTP